ncbi:hypothetical protein E0485_09620 [Paenibacillus albiflavus]|uniref:Uncharacterized protein n=1 Tax=Paenibacillus albiflavus TaxID=2545760 RepID=A0A4R4EDD2_9BACL|nr:hypothetical protein [Paenibacillus albiflavus]TCZ77729.1 hypothetical protein E0485_09620 [Paenibacillus albiflavus]
MSLGPILVQFREEDDTKLAMHALEELGYLAGMFDYGGKAALHVHVVNQDLTSALEIVQAYGGDLIEVNQGEEAKLYNEAYNLDTIPIPAHLVNEIGEDIDPDSSDYVNTLAADDAISGFDAGIHL